MESEPTFGTISENTSGTGSKTRWKATVCLHGPMVENITESTTKIKNTATEYFNGQTIAAMKASGALVSDMAKGRSSTKTDLDKMDYGILVN